MEGDTIIGLKNRRYYCENCRYRWGSLTGGVSCPRCVSPNIILTAIFGHGTYQHHEHRVNGEHQEYTITCSNCKNVVSCYRKCVVCEGFVCYDCIPDDITIPDRLTDKNECKGCRHKKNRDKREFVEYII